MLPITPLLKASFTRSNQGYMAIPQIARQFGLPSKEEVEIALQGIAARFKEPAVQEHFKSFKRDVVFNFTDINASYLFKIHEATITPTALQTDKQQVEVIIDGATFIGILNQSIDGFSAFLDGRLKVHGPISDLLKLQELLK